MDKLSTPVPARNAPDPIKAKTESSATKPQSLKRCLLPTRTLSPSLRGGDGTQDDIRISYPSPNLNVKRTLSPHC